MAIIQVRNRAINLDANEIPNLDASKITSGTFADARIASSNVSQHATSFDDNKIVNDISTLGLRVHTQENLNASNTNSASFDVFQDSSAISNLTNCSRSSDEFIGTIVLGSGAYETGDYSSTYTLAEGGYTMTGGQLSNWVNGSYSTGSSSTGWYDNSGHSITSSDNITIRFGSSKVIVGFRMYNDSTSNCGTYKFLGSTDDGSSYPTELVSSFAWQTSSGVASAPQNGLEQLFSNSTAFNAVKIQGISGTMSGNPWQTAIHFKVATLSANATGSFEGNPITASSTNKMGAVITYQDNAGTNALNTDIILKLSADNGSNYSTATLTALPDFATGIKMAKVNDLSVTAGTQLKYKIEFANQSNGSKEARIRGVSLQN